MNKILFILLISSTLLIARSDKSEDTKKFLKEFKEKYGYEWGSYGFNMDMEWEGKIDKMNPERRDDREEDDGRDGEPSSNGGKGS